MISLNVRTNSVRKTVTAEITDTPRQVFADNNIDISSSMLNLDGTTLSATDLGSTFEALGVADGTSANLNAIVKADGANI